MEPAGALTASEPEHSAPQSPFTLCLPSLLVQPLGPVHRCFLLVSFQWGLPIPPANSW